MLLLRCSLLLPAFGLSLVAAILPAAPASAETYPWCAAYTDGDTNCSFESLEQCKLTATPGSGSRCQENLQYKAPPPEPQAAVQSSPPAATPPPAKRSRRAPAPQ